MKFIATVLALSASLSYAGASVLDQRAACNADNCARAATGLRGGTASDRLADCSSFFRTTLIPPTPTRTVTVTAAPTPFTRTVSTVTVVRRAEGAEAAGQATSTGVTTTVVPVAIPASASACSGPARYSSACSCAGVKHATGIQPVPFVVTTVTVTPATEVDVTETVTLRTAA